MHTAEHRPGKFACLCLGAALQKVRRSTAKDMTPKHRLGLPKAALLQSYFDFGPSKEHCVSDINRRRSVAVNIDGVKIGGNNPIVVQSMTNTDTVDVEGTALQVEQLARAGSELVRVTVNTRQAAEAVPHIAEKLGARGISVPIIGDFHYNGHILLKEYPECARALGKYRINPGNVGPGQHHDKNFQSTIEVAI